MIIAVTGHRPQKLGNEWDGIGPYSEYLTARFLDILPAYKCTKAISGMALGVDMLFAEAAISLGIPVTAAVPFEGQERIWPQKSKDRYNRILSNPLVTKEIICEGGYSPVKMQIRNMWMVDECDMLVAVYDGTPGGTQNCLNYAESKSKELYFIPIKHF